MEMPMPPKCSPLPPFVRAVLFAALALAGLTPGGVPCAQAQNGSVGGLVVRTRMIGVYDAETGEPIDSAEVKDVLTGLSALTTATGTLLLPMDTAGAMLRIRKVGYNMRMLVIPNGAADTLPITFTLDRVGQMLPTVTTRARGVARGPADTVHKLDLTGFYDRRQQGAAPPNAYVSEAQLDHWKPTLMSDLTALTGRPWMFDCTIYIDGALTPIPQPNLGPGRVAMNLDKGINSMLDPSMVAGIEIYRAGEVPPQYNATQVGAGAMTTGAEHSGCVTLIWTR
jgi:hypothetical protein